MAAAAQRGRRMPTSRRDRLRFAPSPSINSVRFIAGEVRRPTGRVIGVQLEIRL
jgi:hypothetical protein